MVFMDENGDNVGRKTVLHQKYASQKGVCPLCGTRMPPLGDLVDNLHDAANLDHIIPRAKGGRDLVSNIQATHQRCNNAKGAGE